VNLPGQAADVVPPGATAPDFAGMLTIKNFQMVNQSLISRLFSAASLTGRSDPMPATTIGQASQGIQIIL